MHGFIEFNGVAKSPDIKKPPLLQGSLFESLQLVEITRESPVADIKALVGKDAVHSAGTQSVEEIMEYRLGGEAFNRTCFAVRNVADGELQSAIYVHKAYNYITTPRDLPDNVREILGTPAACMVDALVTATGFYSITRLGEVKGAGEVLIRKLHDHLTRIYPQAVLTTLSPLRQPVNGKEGIDDFIVAPGRQDWDKLSETQQRVLALEFLLQKREGVQAFHMGNGAIIGDIKLDADSVGRHRVMVNYIYNTDMAKLTANAAAFCKAVGGEDLMPLVSPFLADEIRRSAVPLYGIGSAPGVAPA